MTQFGRQLTIFDIEKGLLAGEAIIFWKWNGIAPIFKLILKLELFVVKARIAKPQTRFASGHRKLVFTADAPVIGANVEIVDIDGQDVGVGFDAACVFDRILVLQAISAHKKCIQAEATCAQLAAVIRIE